MKGTLFSASLKGKKKVYCHATAGVQSQLVCVKTAQFARVLTPTRSRRSLQLNNTFILNVIDIEPRYYE